MKECVFEEKLYNPFKKTALKRCSVSAPVRELINNNILYGRVLDYGCGYGYDVEYFRILGLDAYGYDAFNTEFASRDVLDKHYDIVMCNYCLNTIYSLETHNRVVEELLSICDNVYISVRTDVKAVKDYWKYDVSNKAYITSTGSVQRFYNKDMIKELFGDVCYITYNSSFALFKL